MRFGIINKNRLAGIKARINFDDLINMKNGMVKSQAQKIIPKFFVQNHIALVSVPFVSGSQLNQEMECWHVIQPHHGLNMPALDSNPTNLGWNMSKSWGKARRAAKLAPITHHLKFSPNRIFLAPSATKIIPAAIKVCA